MREAIPIKNIIIGSRCRKDMGDIDSLAKSIDSIGLLQPVGIDADCNLVFGERRLSACQQLGWSEIPVVIFDLANPLQAENDENEVRKDFTPSERVAIGRAIEEQINRKGSNQYQKVEVQNFAPPDEGKKSREVAAEKAGFGNPETYRQAKHVVDNAPTEITEKMDRGELSINKAYQVTKKIEQFTETERPSTVQDVQKFVKEYVQNQEETNPVYSVSKMAYRLSVMKTTIRDVFGSMKTGVQNCSYGDLEDLIRDLSNIHATVAEWLNIARMERKGRQEIRRVK